MHLNRSLVVINGLPKSDFSVLIFEPDSAKGHPSDGLCKTWYNIPQGSARLPDEVLDSATAMLGYDGIGHYSALLSSHQEGEQFWAHKLGGSLNDQCEVIAKNCSNMLPFLPVCLACLASILPGFVCWSCASRRRFWTILQLSKQAHYATPFMGWGHKQYSNDALVNNVEREEGLDQAKFCMQWQDVLRWSAHEFWMSCRLAIWQSEE